MSTDQAAQQPETMPSSSSAAQGSAQRGGSPQHQSQSQAQQQETNGHTQQQTSDPSPQSQHQQEAQSTTDPAQNQPPPPQPPSSGQPAPPPSQPTEQEITPGPRALRLQQLFTTTLSHTLDKISLDNFAACYPTIASRAPGTLEFVQRQMVERLGVQCNKEFNSILQAREVVGKLNELEGLVGEAGRRRSEAGGGSPPVPPHTLPPSTILQAHLAPHLSTTQATLSAELQKTQAENHALFNEIQAQRAEIEELLGVVEKALKDVEGANELLGAVVDKEGGGGDGGLAEEIRGVDGEITAVGGEGR
ncbi:Nnf1-domain-containing protein [Sordaria brevicollis]|uniref:Nnf1-domain-containing protein n=1 Tax=Sordaria brevicollis TaxID=83679 RepID=A0AAE0PFV8_SORBR|nr:Nnf1-domain-containing protein [Sordaria brevicollis]